MVVCLAVPASICIGVAAGSSGQTGAADRPATAGEVFENVQVLQDMPVDDFLASMGLMCASLGWDCANCHVNAGTREVDWAADPPEKIMARRMVRMVDAINRDHFGGRQVVSCFTCHHSRDRPLLTPTMEHAYGAPALYADDLFAGVPGAPPPETILDKYIEALGGAQRVSELSSYRATATSVGFGGFGGGGTVSIWAQAPDRRSTIIEFRDAQGRDNSARTYNGSAGWINTPLSVLGEYALSGTELDGARFDAMIAFPDQLGQVLSNLRVGHPDYIDGRPVEVVQGSGPRGLVVTLYFDQQSGLLTRYVRYGRSPIGRLPTQVDYADYRDINGIMIPHTWTFSWLDGRDLFEVTNIELNVPIDESVFGRPSLIAAIP